MKIKLRKPKTRPVAREEGGGAPDSPPGAVRDRVKLRLAVAAGAVEAAEADCSASFR